MCNGCIKMCIGAHLIFVACVCVVGWEFTARQDYFAHFEPSQSVGGAKMGDP